MAIAVHCSFSMMATEVSHDSVPPVVSFMNRWSAATSRMMLGASGYIPVGNKVALGPLASFVGFNTLEGLRLGLGLKTTPSLLPNLAFGGYGAYAFHDHQWKYQAEAMWLFEPASYYFGAYPANGVRIKYSYDTYQLGENVLRAVAHNSPFRFSLRRNEMILYKRFGNLSFFFEPSTNSSLEIAAERERYYPTRYISFGNMINHLDAWSMKLTAGYIPGGDFFQTKSTRIDVKPYAPRLRGKLQWIKGSGNNRCTNMMIAEVAGEKFTSVAEGVASLMVMIHGAVTLGHGAFPFLPSLPSSPYILRRFGSFALLQPLELPADRFIDAHLLITDEGFLLNKIPGIRLLNWAIMITLGASVGDLSHGNNPAYRSALPAFPYTPGQMLSWSHPYSEIGIGIDRILGIARIEYVRRLSYTSNYGTRSGGISLGLDIKF